MERFAAMPVRRGRLARLAVVLSVAVAGTTMVGPGATSAKDPLPAASRTLTAIAC